MAVDNADKVVLQYEGQTYILKKNLTIGEILELSGKRFVLTGGQYDVLRTSKLEADRDMAFITDIVVEFDARMLEAPDDWKGAQFESDTKKLVDLWGLWVENSGFFRSPDSARDGKAEGKTQGESGGESQGELEEDLVSEEIQPAS